VLVKGTKSGTQTDFDGKFSIKTTQISFWYLAGMKSKIATSSSNVSVKLMDDSVQLEGVIVGHWVSKETRIH
jgi:hypothetical protein